MTTLTPEQQATCDREGYSNPVIIDGKLCALAQMFTTVGIVYNIQDIGYDCRFCFKEYQDAAASLREWAQTGSVYPEGPWIKVKGRFAGVYLDADPDHFTELMRRKETSNG